MKGKTPEEKEIFNISDKRLEMSFLRILTAKKHRQIKIPALAKSTNMGIWVVGTTNQLFIRGS